MGGIRMELKTRLDVYKWNTIQLAKHHRKFCDGRDCNISLIVLMEMAEKAGIKFTKRERRLFI